MYEFNNQISSDQADFLTENKLDLCKTASGREIWQNRIKKASESYAILKQIRTNEILDSLVVGEAIEIDDLLAVNDEGIDSVDDEQITVDPEEFIEENDLVVDEKFPDWRTYRDGFILDWIGSRIVVTNEEADMIYENAVDEALATLDGETTEPVVETSGESEEAPATKRGRPKGAKKAAKTKVSAKALTIYNRYKEKGWERKRILDKMQGELGMGKAYAATLYQKFNHASA